MPRLVGKGVGGRRAPSAVIGSFLGLTTQPSTSCTSGDALATQPVVQLSRPIANVTVTASLVTASGATVSNSTATSNANGVATFSGLTLTGSAGARRLQFTATGWETVTAGADTTIGGGGSGALSLTTQPDIDAMTGVVLITQPVVQLEDGAGNPDPTASVTVTCTVVGGGPTLAGDTAVTNASGVATFTGLKLTGTYDTYRLQFTATNYGSVDAAADTELHQATPVQDWWPGVTPDYADTTALRNDNTYFTTSEDNNIGQITLDTTVGFGKSSESMLYTYPAGSADEYTLGRNLRLASNYSAIWFEVWVRFSSNFTTAGQPSSTKAQSFKFLFGRMLNAGGWRTSFEIQTTSPHWRCGPPQDEELYGVNTTTFPIANAWDGANYRVRGHCKRSTNRSTSDGALMFWADNIETAPAVNPGAITYFVSSQPSTDPENFYGLAWGRNMNRGTPSGVTMTIHWLRGRVWTSDPGWPTS